MALWLLPEEQKSEHVPEIVTHSEGGDRRKCIAWLTKLYCDKMIKNGYRMKVIKKEPGTEQELDVVIKKEPGTEQELDVHKMDVIINNAAAPRMSLGDIPTSAHQSTSELTSSSQYCPVTKTAVTPVVSSPCKRKRTNSFQQTTKKPCVVNLRSIKAIPTKDNQFIRTGKINLSTLKTQSSTEADKSLKRIIQQKNMSLNVMKLPTTQLPARRLWPSPKSAPSIDVSSIAASKPESDDFMFNLDKVISRAAKEFSFTSPTAKVASDDNPKRNAPSVFQRLGEQQSPFKTTETPPVEPKTPPYGPQNDEDFLELHTVDDLFDEMTDIHPPAKIASKTLPPSQQQASTVTAPTKNVSSATVPATTRPSVQKCVQFSDRLLPQQEKHQQITQWVNSTRIDPPPPPPGYHASSDKSGPALFSFPSSPVPTPTMSLPEFDDDFDTLSVQLNVPKEANSTMEDARKLISDAILWNRRESVNSNGLIWCGAPKGMCFKYWGTGICPHHQICKFHHVRNPAVDVSYVCTYLCSIMYGSVL